MMYNLRSLFCENSDDDIAGSQKSGANCTSSAESAEQSETNCKSTAEQSKTLTTLYQCRSAFSLGNDPAQ